MELNYNLTEQDYINFNIHHVKRSKTGKRALIWQRFLAPLFFIIVAFLLANIGDIPLLAWLITFIITGLLWIIFYPKYFYGHIARNVKKMIREGKNEGLLGNHTLKLTEEGLLEESFNKETKVKWSGLTSFIEEEDYFYIYISSLSAFILPKREIDQVEEVKEYIELMSKG